MAIFEGFQLTLNCDFVAIADRKNCQVFYGQERLLGEDVAAYSFFDDPSFDRALTTATALSGRNYFEKLWSAKRFEDRPGGYICLKRLSGLSLLEHMNMVPRKKQFQLCLQLVEALSLIHKQGAPHGALDQDNVLFCEQVEGPYILEVLSGFDADQLEPHLSAPEQLAGLHPNYATVVYWLANLYLMEIKRPSSGLKRLIKKCLEGKYENRPTLDSVQLQLRHLYQNDFQIALGRWLQPQRAIKVVGVVLLASASGILALDQKWIQTSPQVPPSFEMNLEKNMGLARDDDSKIETLKKGLRAVSSDQERVLIFNKMIQLAEQWPNLTPELAKILKNSYENEKMAGVREEIIETLSEIKIIRDDHFGEAEKTVANLEESLVGVMIFDWPVILFGNQVWELGDWVNVQGQEGYISRINLNQFSIKKGRDVTPVLLQIPETLSTLNDLNRNVYFPGEAPNFKQFVQSFKSFGYDIITVGDGGSDGILKGFFSFESPDDLIHAASSHLGLTISNKTVWIEDIEDLRTFVYINSTWLKDQDCQSFFSQILDPLGISYSFSNGSCEIPKLFFINGVELKEIFNELGFQYSLADESFNITLTRKE